MMHGGTEKINCWKEIGDKRDKKNKGLFVIDWKILPPLIFKATLNDLCQILIKKKVVNNIKTTFCRTLT